MRASRYRSPGMIATTRGTCMRLERLRALRYRSLRDVDVEIQQLNILIGSNAAGKSNILDVLRFLSTGVRERDFAIAVNQRGRFLALGWKGAPASDIRLTTSFRNQAGLFEWSVGIESGGPEEFGIEETVTLFPQAGGPQQQLLAATAGKGWWYSEEPRKNVSLAQGATTCALAAAAADASFPARAVAEFVAGWSFFDPTPSQLRRSAPDVDSGRLDSFGRNLAARLRALKMSTPDLYEHILSSMERVLGVPQKIELRETPDHEVYFVQMEPGLTYPVHQIGASSGTLRMLALMTALLGESQAGLIGIEEPENYIHPAALVDFAQYLQQASERVQLMVTTHSPLLLNCIEDPSAVLVVARSESGTSVVREEHPDAVRKALEESGFALGEYLQTRGFGA